MAVAGVIRSVQREFREAADDLPASYRAAHHQLVTAPGVVGASISVWLECAAEIAAARVVLAEALVVAGDMDEAERLARQECEVLAPVGHPAFPDACITLAIVGSAGDWVDAAIHAWESDPFLLLFYRILGLDTAAARLEAAGMAVEAERCRTAERQKGSLVLTTSN
jgi:hypothetical protein